MYWLLSERGGCVGVNRAENGGSKFPLSLVEAQNKGGAGLKQTSQVAARDTPLSPLLSGAVDVAGRNA